MRTHLVRVPEASHAHPRHVLHEFQTCLTHISDVFEYYLGAELYRSTLFSTDVSTYA